MAEAKNVPLPPHDMEAEEYVVGSCMLAGYAIDECAEILTGRDFYRESHGLLFDTAVRMRAEGVPVDAVTLAGRIEADGNLTRIPEGKERIREIATIVPVAANAAHHAALVKEAAVLRRLAETGLGMYRDAHRREGDAAVQLDRAEMRVFDIARENDRSEFVTLEQTVPEAWARLEELHAGGRTVVGVPSGLTVLDELTSGFQAGNLVIVAARPSMGKSALAVGVAGEVVLRQGLPVALFTLEMSKGEVTSRMLSVESGVDGRRMRSGRINPEDWSKVATASDRLTKAPLFIDDGRLITVAEIRSKCRRLKVRRPDLAMVIVDYLQLMETAGMENDRVRALGQISRSLKVLAGDLEVPVLALSQLSRAPESRHDHRPVLSDLRESGALEQDADVVLFLYRDEYYHPDDTDQQGIAEINVAKQRNGPTGTVKVSFLARTTRFGNLASSAQQAAEPG